MAVFSMRLPGSVITVSPQACPASARDLLKYMHAAVRALAFCEVGVALCGQGLSWAGLDWFFACMGTRIMMDAVVR